ncbi:hypothetical protein [Clostridium estertheticum]|nr:hypothetical protein [Clostridium estertheticum]
MLQAIKPRKSIRNYKVELKKASHKDIGSSPYIISVILNKD